MRTPTFVGFPTAPIFFLAELPVAAVAALAALPRLESLTVAGVPTDDLVAEIATRARGLRSLVLRGDSISDSALEAISSMPRVRSLFVSGGVVTDAGVAPLAKLDTLERLDLSGCWLLTKAGLRELRKRFSERRGPDGVPVRIEHESLPFARSEAHGERDGKGHGRPSKGPRKSGGSDMWLGVGPGGSRSPAQVRKAGGAKGGQLQPGEKKRSEATSRRESRGKVVGESATWAYVSSCCVLH